MSEAHRTIRLLTNDEALLASARAAAEGLDGWEVCHLSSSEELMSEPPEQGDLLLLDAWSSRPVSYTHLTLPTICSV